MVNSRFFDSTLEKKLLTNLLYSIESIEYALLANNLDCFQGLANRRLYDLICRYYRKYFKILSREILNIQLRREPYKDNEKIDIQLLFSEVSGQTPDDHTRFYIEELKNLRINRGLHDVFETLRTELNNESVAGQEALIAVSTKIAEVSRDNAQDEITRTTLSDDTNARLNEYEDKKLHPEKYLGVPFGFTKIDDATGGIFPSKLGLIFSRTGIGKCIAGDTEILCTDGVLRSIQEIVSRQEAKIFTLNTSLKVKETRPLNYVYSGKQQVYRLLTTSGRNIKLTATHPLLSVSGWQQLKDLRIGDRIAVPRILPVFGKKPMGMDKVKLLAYFIAEGGLCSGTPTFSNEDEKIRKDFTIAINNVFPEITVKTYGTRVPVNKRCLIPSLNKDRKIFCRGCGKLTLPGKRTNYLCIPCYHRLYNAALRHSENILNLPPKMCVNPVKTWLNDYGLCVKSVQKILPQDIFELPEEQLATFLGVLWSCDGSIHGDKYQHITYECGSPQLTKQVAHLLLRFGITGSYREHYNTYNGKKFIVGSFVVCSTSKETFLKRIGKYFVGEKQKRVVKALEYIKSNKQDTNVDTIPINLIWPHLPKCRKDEVDQALIRKTLKDKFTISYVKDWDKRGFARIRVEKLAAGFETSELETLANSDIFWDEIKVIEDAGITDTYDLEIEYTHNFVAADIFVHNSRFLFNLGCNIAKVGRSVMFFTIEMEARELQHMWESRELGTNTDLIRRGIHITYKKIVRALLSKEEEEVYKQFLNEAEFNRIPFYIYDYPRGCTPSAIEAELLSYIRLHGKKPDIILADYANIMRPDGRYDKTHEKFDILFNELKQIARVYKIPFITAIQQNRESLKARQIGTEHIGLSDRAADHCDFILNLRRDEEDPIQDSSIRRIIVEFVKARYTELTTCTLLADFSINYLQDDLPTIVSTPQSVSTSEQAMADPPQSTDVENQDF